MKQDLAIIGVGLFFVSSLFLIWGHITSKEYKASTYKYEVETNYEQPITTNTMNPLGLRPLDFNSSIPTTESYFQIKNFSVISPTNMDLLSSESIKFFIHQERISTTTTPEPKTITSSKFISPTNTPNTIQSIKLPKIGTPGPPQLAFGPEYEAFVIAELAGAAFDIHTVSSEAQALDQEKLVWIWNIKPETTGNHVVNLSIDVAWYRKNGQGLTIQRHVQDTQFNIEVTQPIFTWGQISLPHIIGLIGTLMTIPAFSEKFLSYISSWLKRKTPPITKQLW